MCFCGVTRLVTAFFAGSRFTVIGFFGATWATVENVGNTPGVTCANVNADCGGCTATRVTIGGGAKFAYWYRRPPFQAVIRLS